MESKKRGRPAKDEGKFEGGERVVAHPSEIDEIRRMTHSFNEMCGVIHERKHQDKAEYVELVSKVIVLQNQMDEAIREVKQGTAQIKEDLASRHAGIALRQYEADNLAATNFQLLRNPLIDIQGDRDMNIKGFEAVLESHENCLKILSDNDAQISTEMRCVIIVALGIFALNAFIIYRLLTCH